MTPKSRLRTVGWAAVGLFLLSLLLIRWASGPRYHGRGFGYWFSRWDSLGEVDGRDDPRLEVLAEAGPEVVPLLVSALAVEDGPLGRAYNAVREDLPRGFQHRLPRWRGADEIRSDAYGVLRRQFGRPGHVRAFTGLVDRVPAWALSASCETLSGYTGVVDIVEPHLRRLVKSGDPEVAVEAGVGWFWLREAPAAERDAMLAALARQPDAAFAEEHRVPGPLLARRLIGLGAGAAGAESWMQRWQFLTNQPRLAVCGVMVLGAIDPTRYPLERLLPGLVPGMGSDGLRTLSVLAVSSERERHPQSAALGRVLGPFLEPAAAGRLAEEWERRAAEAGRRNSGTTAVGVQLQILAVLERLGREAQGARPWLIPLLSARDETVAWRAALGLARLGPVEPETIPRLVPGLTNWVTAPPVLLLLAAYGPAARPVLPWLDPLERDDWGPPDGWQGPDAEIDEEGTGPFWVPDRRGQLRIGLAVATGLTRVWPSSSSATGGGAFGDPSQGPPVVTVSDLVREARSRIAGETP